MTASPLLIALDVFSLLVMQLRTHRFTSDTDRVTLTLLAPDIVSFGSRHEKLFSRRTEYTEESFRTASNHVLSMKVS